MIYFAWFIFGFMAGFVGAIAAFLLWQKIIHPTHISL